MSKAYKGKSVELYAKISERNSSTELVDFIDEKLSVYSKADLIRLALQTLFETEQNGEIVLSKDINSIKRKTKIINEFNEKAETKSKVIPSQKFKNLIPQKVQSTTNESLEIEEIVLKPQENQVIETNLEEKTLSDQQREELELELLAMLGV